MKTVLLVEDDFDNATLVEDIFAFEDLDAELVITQTGEDALRLAAELQPELILMDLQLPGMGGAGRNTRAQAGTLHGPDPHLGGHGLRDERRCGVGKGRRLQRVFQQADMHSKVDRRTPRRSRRGGCAGKRLVLPHPTRDTQRSGRGGSSCPLDEIRTRVGSLA
jgi:hypothetical protein